MNIGLLLAKSLPGSIFRTLKNLVTLAFGYGQYRTMRRWSSTDAHGEPIPWYTYPALEYLRQLDFSDRRIFEYGSGNSSLFWAKRCKKLVAVENDREWFDRISLLIPKDVDYHFTESKRDYIEAITKDPDPFDIIVIDGAFRHECAELAVSRLSPNGMIILDNSDWWEKTAAMLRNHDLLEIDMTGFGPINGYTWTTSIFLTRQVELRPLKNRQPLHGVGAKTINQE